MDYASMRVVNAALIWQSIIMLVILIKKQPLLLKFESWTQKQATPLVPFLVISRTSLYEF